MQTEIENNTAGRAGDFRPPVERVKEAASDATDAVKKKAADAMDTAKEEGREVLKTIKEKAAEGADEARSTALKIVDGRKNAVAAKVSDYQKAAEVAAEQLKDRGDKTLGDHVGQLASKLENISGYLSNKSVRELGSDLGRITRKHPEVVLGGALLLGFAVTRFLKASSHEGNGYRSGIGDGRLTNRDPDSRFGEPGNFQEPTARTRNPYTGDFS